MNAMKNVLATAALVGLWVIVGCGRKQEEYSAAHLLKTLKEHADPDMRAWAARDLGRFPDKDAATVTALTEALKDPSDGVRLAAAYALADVGAMAAPALPALN